MPAFQLTCSFCGLHRLGGVVGSTPDLYVCPDCILLAHGMVHEPPATADPSDPEGATPA